MNLRRLFRAVAALVAVLFLALLLAALPKAHLADPTPSLLLRDRHGVFLGEIGDRPEDTTGGVAGGDPPPSDPGYGYWPVDELPERVVAATLALEDRRFRSHPGVDPLAVARAMRQNLAAGSVVSGASTLAMQVARMQDPGPRTAVRKAVEATTAVLLTARHGRDAILMQYLRLAPYGNNIHGISYAARRYLDKPVADLSWAETAFLCALPQAPSRTNPFDPKGRDRAVARAHRILGRLAEQGLLDATELAQAEQELDSLRIPERGRRPVETLHVVLRLGEELTDRADPLVDTSLDLALQRTVTTQVRESLERFGEKGARNAAVLVVDRETGEVRAAVGSADYHDRAGAGAIDYTRTPRSPGSTLKPFLYAAALERGLIGPDSVLDDLGRAADAIENADGRALGPMLPRQALANSRNVPAVDLLQKLGLEEGYALFRELGLHDDERPARSYGLGLAIGGLPVRLDALVEAYTSLAGDGHLRPLTWRIDVATAEGPRIFRPSTSALLTLWLSDPVARLPSFPRLGASEYPFPVAVKTGTSADYRDAWTVAWSARWLVGTWVGDPNAEPMVKLGGFQAAAELTQDVLLGLHAADRQGLSDLGFPPPEGWTSARVCPMSGGRATAACPSAVTEWFEHAPTGDCDVHRRIAVDVRDGSPATPATPSRFVREQTFTELPARYAAWQARMGLARAPREAGITLAPTIRVRSPSAGVLVRADPDSPASTLALEAEVEPPSPQVLWLVDGEPFAVVDFPYSARWPIVPGEHYFEARIPYTDIASPTVRITAR